MAHRTNLTLLPALLCLLVLMPSVSFAEDTNAKNQPVVEGVLDCAGLHTGQDSASNPVEHPDCTKKPSMDDAVIEAGLNNTITLQVTNLGEWLDKDASKPDGHKLVPYLDGQPLSGIFPVAVNRGQNKLTYHLQLTSASKSGWVAQLSQHRNHKVNISVGLENKDPFKSNVYFEFQIFPDWAWAYVVVLILALLVFFLLAWRSSILRESGNEPAGGRRKAFSLARSQMAFWFFVILACYMLILTTTGLKDVMPDAVLALMGISAGTYLGATVADGSKRADAQNELAEQATLQTLGAARTPEQNTRLNVLNLKLAQNTSAVNPDQTHGFWLDILSDANGVSLHRFQMVVWTIVMGIWFVISVWSSLVMPELNATMLGLMGISSGTYLGAKFPEQKT